MQLPTMNVTIIHAWPEESAAEEAALVLIGKESLEAARAFIHKQFGRELALQETHAEEGTQQVFAIHDRLLFTLGLGEEPGLESLRHAGYEGVKLGEQFKQASLCLLLPGMELDASHAQALTEGVALSGYHFDKYLSKPEAIFPENVKVWLPEALTEASERGLTISEVTCLARDLVNEPVITLTAVELGNRIEALGRKYGFTTDVWNKSKIQAMKMGGILAVNAGSQDPPTFSIMEYKPPRPNNERPIVLVGKGVVYDTGGLSLKPTANSMDFMKADMAGAAAVVGALCGVAALKLNYHVVGLVPATDNRPGQRAYTPGDVIHMHDGSTVEVLNTDAEGRMLLADALAYAKNYQPELVIDLATLTGAAVVAVGHEGTAVMGNAPERLQALKEAGERVFERLVELPLWKEYRKQLKSDIADLKNIGNKGAGAITAGKFLEHFTDYPWLHLDIAGSSWLPATSSYRGKNGTGVGVRLLLDFISTY